MPKQTTWKCDNCGLEKEGGFRTPYGWIETSFYTGTRFIRNSFCSYVCLAEWASKRYDKQPSFIGEEVNEYGKT